MEWGKELLLEFDVKVNEWTIKEEFWVFSQINDQKIFTGIYSKIIYFWRKRKVQQLLVLV